jgi:ABC-type branched-subunit amino acid transport system permease subunit
LRGEFGARSCLLIFPIYINIKDLTLHLLSFFYVFLHQRFSEYPSVSLLILGGIVISVILVAPRGIMGTIQEKLGFEILSPRRK